MLVYVRFSVAVHAGEGSEKEKFANAKKAYAEGFAGGMLQTCLIGGDNSRVF